MRGVFVPPRYQAGYGTEPNNRLVHYAPMLAALKSLGGPGRAINETIESVLDVGCSSGYGVNELWKMGVKASGVDISATAVRVARQRHGDRPERCIDTCWQTARAMALPFANASVDAILSTDVLEHLTNAAEVHATVAELTRVARTWLLLKIADRHESSRMEKLKAPSGKDATDTFASVVRRSHGRELPPNLHTTVQPGPWWIAKFKAMGFDLHRNVQMPSWACCGFVLRRRAANERRYIP